MSHLSVWTFCVSHWRFWYFCRFYHGNSIFQPSTFRGYLSFVSFLFCNLAPRFFLQTARITESWVAGLRFDKQVTRYQGHQATTLGEMNGNDPNSLAHILQMGWLHHQLVQSLISALDWTLDLVSSYEVEFQWFCSCKRSSFNFAIGFFFGWWFGHLRKIVWNQCMVYIYHYLPKFYSITTEM